MQKNFRDRKRGQTTFELWEVAAEVVKILTESGEVVNLLRFESETFVGLLLNLQYSRAHQVDYAGAHRLTGMVCYLVGSPLCIV